MLLVLFATLGFLGAWIPQASAANCHMREIDLCIATILISGTDGVPADEEEMDKVCEPIQEGFDCIGNYSKTCLTPLMQEVYDMIMAEPVKVQRSVCTPGSDERAQYLKNAPCFQKVLSNDNMKPHMDDLMAALEKATESKFQERIPVLCCGIQRLFKTSVDMVEKECGQGVLDEGSQMIGMSVSSLSDMFCRGYESGSDKCNGILPPPGSPYKGVESDNQLIRFISSAMANFS